MLIEQRMGNCFLLKFGDFPLLNKTFHEKK